MTAEPEASRRIAMRVAYDGTDFVGWQRQRVGRSVQGELEAMLGKLAGDRMVTVVGSGRTDSGVHAAAQVAHADLPIRYSDAELLHALRRMSRSDIALLDLVGVDENFHARFDAHRRRYRYAIHTTPDPFRSRYSWYLDRPLNLDKLDQAAAAMVGHRDFTALSKHNPDTPNMICDLRVSEWHHEDGGLSYHIVADRFLYGMVRLAVGFQIDIALGTRSTDELVDSLEARDRTGQSGSAPACGLSLMEVSYPRPIFP